ncbi:MAG: 50S ribosomal protein L9 [Alkalispirochaeta sp.]
MKVILNHDVENLGEEGDIRVVKPGYARNYLLPQGLVMEHSPRNIALIEERRVVIEERKAEKRKLAAGLKERIEAEPLKISMTAGTNGKLFGSVSAATIAERLAAQGIEIERKRIDIPEHSIKTVGNFKVGVRLYGDQEATLTVAVEASNARELEKAKAKEDASKEGVVKEAKEAVAKDDAAKDDAAQDDAAVEEDLDPEVMAMRAAMEEEAAAKTTPEEPDEPEEN